MRVIVLAPLHNRRASRTGSGIAEHFNEGVYIAEINDIVLVDIAVLEPAWCGAADGGDKGVNVIEIDDPIAIAIAEAG
jgi:hypothetical protein